MIDYREVGFMIPIGKLRLFIYRNKEIISRSGKEKGAKDEFDTDRKRAIRKCGDTMYPNIGRFSDRTGFERKCPEI